MLFLEKQWKFFKKNRDIKLSITYKWRNQLVSVPIYYTTKCFSEDLLAMET